MVAAATYSCGFGALGQDVHNIRCVVDIHVTQPDLTGRVSLGLFRPAELPCGEGLTAMALWMRRKMNGSCWRTVAVRGARWSRQRSG
jgi:hypothetical protein